MSYTLEQLATDCRSALQADSGPGGREKIRQHVQRALQDKDFLATHLGDAANKERDILYEDPDWEFCICAHVYNDAKSGKPHDHGPTWAIYGQAEGETEMTDWRIVAAPQNGQPGKVEMVRSYRLKPGDAHLYEVGAVHAPLREKPTKLIRIEGKDTNKVQRTPLQAIVA